ncbi:uncharacterized protein [Equus asinus]|uniref:uncharacterized protein isoform X2 n=1 Tax=Equus asinus TaxID=9793 RepID=UPI0038F7C58A
MAGRANRGERPRGNPALPTPGCRTLAAGAARTSVSAVEAPAALPAPPGGARRPTPPAAPAPPRGPRRAASLRAAPSSPRATPPGTWGHTAPALASQEHCWLEASVPVSLLALDVAPCGGPASSPSPRAGAGRTEGAHGARGCSAERERDGVASITQVQLWESMSLNCYSDRVGRG